MCVAKFRSYRRRNVDHKTGVFRNVNCEALCGSDAHFAMGRRRWFYGRAFAPNNGALSGEMFAADRKQQSKSSY